MSHISFRFFTTIALAALVTTAVGTAQGQAKPILASTTLRADAGQHRGARDRLITARVREGVLTIDGMVAKIQLNYNIEDTGYLYFFVPGVGTAVLSRAPFAGGAKVQHGFDRDTLEFTLAGHSFQLSSATSLLSKRRNRGMADVYVRLDRSTMALSHYPKIGYGNTSDPPYTWPLSLPEPISKEKVAYIVTPPPMPRSILPQTATTQAPGTP